MKADHPTEWRSVFFTFKTWRWRWSTRT